MPDDDPSEWIVVTEDAKTLPIAEILTGRGFVSGKSGSGKSNTVSVIAEELLENNFNLLIVDTEGEYYGLKEEYQLLHVGGDEFAEVQVTPDHAEKIAEIALLQNVPVILDVSGFDDTDESEALIEQVVSELYSLEKTERKPFLLLVEEMQEYLPQQGGSSDLAELLERVAKRGRKRGLGMCGISQRPASIDKDFITQCDWMVWHKFTWENDLNLVSKIIGSEKADEVEEFDPGEAYLMTDWDDTLERVQFKRKRTFDAGATPGLESYERPDLKQVGDELIAEIGTESGGDIDAISQMASTGQNADDDVPSPDELLSDLDSTPESGANAIDPSDADGELSGPDAVESNVVATDGDAAAVDGDATDLDEDATDLDENATDLDEMDEETLRTELERTQKRNRILEDETQELRTVLENVQREEPPSQFQNSVSDGDGTETREPGPGTGTRPGTGTGTGTGLELPSRPQPPDPPENRGGVAGSLLEFASLWVFLMQSIWFLLRLVGYRLRIVVEGRSR